MNELTEDQKANQAIFQKVKELLDGVKKTTEQHKMDCYLFIDIIVPANKGEGILTCSLGGTIQGYVQSLVQVAKQPTSPLLRCMMIAVANCLAMDGDTDSRILAEALLLYDAALHGGGEICECPECVAKRANNAKNVNIN